MWKLKILNGKHCPPRSLLRKEKKVAPPRDFYLLIMGRSIKFLTEGDDTVDYERLIGKKCNICCFWPAFDLYPGVISKKTELQIPVGFLKDSEINQTNSCWLYHNMLSSGPVFRKETPIVPISTFVFHKRWETCFIAAVPLILSIWNYLNITQKSDGLLSLKHHKFGLHCLHFSKVA